MDDQSMAVESGSTALAQVWNLPAMNASAVDTYIDMDTYVQDNLTEAAYVRTRLWDSNPQKLFLGLKNILHPNPSYCIFLPRGPDNTARFIGGPNRERRSRWPRRTSSPPASGSGSARRPPSRRCSPSARTRAARRRTPRR
jgi:hypothetical protein